MVGFNRRFAPLLTTMRSRLRRLAAASSNTRYLVNAGKLANDSWYLNEEAEGPGSPARAATSSTRWRWWADSLPEEVYAVSGPEKGDVQATFRFAGGATGTIAYLTGGNTRFPKETMDVTGGGRSARLDNFETATVWSSRGKAAAKARGGQDKGQRAEMEQFVEAVAAGGPMPIGIDSLLATTRATIAVGESLASGKPERCDADRLSSAHEALPGTRAGSAGCRPARSPGESGSRRCAGPGRAGRCARARWPRCRR